MSGIDLHGRVAVVTGGARGIGAGIAEALVGAGAQVMLSDIEEETGLTTAHRLGGGTIFSRQDVSSAADWKRVVGETLARFGRLDILINNAGILVRGTIEQTDEAALDKVWRVNAVGTFLGMKAVIAPMREAGGGSIVNVSSVGAIGGYPAIFAYATTKWAIRGMTKSAARALGPHNIRVNAVMPGSIMTDILADVPEETHRQRIAATPLSRLGVPKDVAGAALFLASDHAAFITGADIIVDGGMTV